MAYGNGQRAVHFRVNDGTLLDRDPATDLETAVTDTPSGIITIGAYPDKRLEGHACKARLGMPLAVGSTQRNPCLRVAKVPLFGMELL